MNVTRLLSLCVLLVGMMSLTVAPAHAWGQNGHRVVGDIAELHLTPWAAAQVRTLLGTESLARASTWPDEIRSDRAWDYTHTWHYINLEDGETLDTIERNPKGDVLEAMQRMVDILRNPDAGHRQQVEALRFLVHFVGDVHQPLHSGRASDRGGNDISVIFFREPMNLHTVWDSGLLDRENLSFTEMVRFYHHPTAEEVATWQDSTFRDWVEESIALRHQVYDFGPQDGSPDDPPKIGYEYKYQNIDLVQQRLVQAGVRLAGVLNKIYAKPAGHDPL